jgi:7-cyano-7-deazaguanine synthase
MDGYDLLLLFSGGADSRLMLEISIQMGKNPFCLLVDYGQKHVKELEYASCQLEDKKIDFEIVKLSNFNINSALTGDGSKGIYKGVSIYNVPARNSIFLSLAAGIAESLNIHEIWIGCDMSDYYGQFPDCKQEYIGRINRVFEIAFSFPIEVKAPLLGWTKEMVVDYLQRILNINKSKLFSGYGEYT